MSLSVGYPKGDGGPSYFPLSTGTDRLHARNHLINIELKVLPRSTHVDASPAGRDNAPDIISLVGA